MISTRIKGFLWHAGMMALAVVIDYAIQSLTGFQFSPIVTVVLGLVLGQVSKAVHEYLINDTN